MGDRRIGARELRQDLATQLRRAAGGQRLVVTVGGRPTAVLGPVEDSTAETTVDALVTAGALLPARRHDTARRGPPIAVWSGVRLDRVFADVRG
jgi:prevent-host-death family protein